MICNRTPTGWEVIFQRAHALLAAELVRPWRRDQRPRLWFETLHAIAQHDDGWQEWEPDEHLLPSGAPRSFTETSLAAQALHGASAVERASHQSLWAGLLVARHIAELHGARQGESPELDAVLAEQRRLQERWRDRLQVTEDRIERAYALLRWGDTLSLRLCCRELDDVAFSATEDIETSAPIGPGPGGDHTEHVAVLTGDAAITVRPWPYDEDRFEVGVDTYLLPRERFASEEDFVEALREADYARRKWTVHRDR